MSLKGSHVKSLTSLGVGLFVWGFLFVSLPLQFLENLLNRSWLRSTYSSRDTWGSEFPGIVLVFEAMTGTLTPLPTMFILEMPIIYERKETCHATPSSSFPLAFVVHFSVSHAP